jgi:hypothetical protein
VKKVVGSLENEEVDDNVVFDDDAKNPPLVCCKCNQISDRRSPPTSGRVRYTVSITTLTIGGVEKNICGCCSSCSRLPLLELVLVAVVKEIVDPM